MPRIVPGATGRILTQQLATSRHALGSGGDAGRVAPLGDASTMELLQYVEELSHSLDAMYSERSITFELDGENPVLKATWTPPPK